MPYKLIILLLMANVSVLLAGSLTSGLFDAEDKIELPSKRENAFSREPGSSDDLFARDEVVSASAGGPGSDPGGMIEPPVEPPALPVTKGFSLFILSGVYTLYRIFSGKKRVKGNKKE